MPKRLPIKIAPTQNLEALEPRLSLHSVLRLILNLVYAPISPGRDEIRHIVDSLRVGGGDSIINKAHAFYQVHKWLECSSIKIEPTFKLFILSFVRQTKKAYLLIDFSDYLQINVYEASGSYVLGAVFLQLCKILSLLEHPIVQKLVDPSLFIHRFTERKCIISFLHFL
ncbi:hypothetical protein BHE74_00005736 [Ensete ventricosum]|nr:hypothetical protein BHE74_00005736 [Ensete ventricosum]